LAPAATSAAEAEDLKQSYRRHKCLLHPVRGAGVPQGCGGDVVRTLGKACGCVDGVKSHPLQKRQRMGHPRDGEFEKKRDKAGHPSVPQDYDSKVVRTLGKACGCVGGVEIPPFAKAAKDGAPTGW
jgi:hypothetical protein